MTDIQFNSNSLENLLQTPNSMHLYTVLGCTLHTWLCFALLKIALNEIVSKCISIWQTFEIACIRIVHVCRLCVCGWQLYHHFKWADDQFDASNPHALPCAVPDSLNNDTSPFVVSVCVRECVCVCLFVCPTDNVGSLILCA